MKFRPQYLLTIISVALMLYFAGIYSIFSLQSDYFMNIIKERIDIMVELNDEVNSESRKDFTVNLDTLKEVKKSSVRYISSQQAKAEMESEFGEDFLLEGMENPFNEVVLFQVNPEFYNNEDLARIGDKLTQMEIVKEVSYQEDVFEPVRANLNRFSRIILIIGILLIGGALILIHNTLKLSLNSKRKVIKTMELVGARTGFVLKPFMWQGFWQGLISGLIASAGIYLTLYLIGEWLPVFKSIIDTERSYIIMGSVILSGILIFLIVTYYTVKRYLRIQMDDIF